MSFVLVAAGSLLVVASARGAEAPAAEAKPAPAASAAEAPPAEAFATKLEAWKSVLKELRSLRAAYEEATDAEIPSIRTQFDEALARGEQLIPELRATGKAAYVAAPQQDRELERFLVEMLKDDLARDNYEAAADVANAMVDSGCDLKEVKAAAGVAAFVTNDYERAETYLPQADELDALDEKGQQYLAELDQYKEFWEAERAIREKEAQDDNLPRIRITTNKGEMLVELFENEAPETVANFISLVEKGFYNDLTFHRVLPQFMAQGGCPLGDGTGGPGYQIFCECTKDDYRKHFRGTLSMAHSGPNTGGSQFFLTFVPTSHLNGRHTAFGRVIEGLDVLSKLQRIDPDDTGTKPDPDKMLKVEVVRKREHDYQPNKVQ
jgi:cyclophilin family peptidyl-prolyl cis-trans isomerase